MPIHGYPGNIITANPTAPTVSSASGVWTTEQQLQAVSQGNWPGYEYPISRSLRFNSADSAYLNRTPASSGNQQKHTYSAWVKRGALGSSQNIFGAGTSTSGPYSFVRFDSSDKLDISYVSSGPTSQCSVQSAAVYRDASAWYHVVVAIDTTQATAANRIIAYVNGVQVTLSGTQPTQNTNLTGFNQNIANYVGSWTVNSTSALNGYLTEVNFIDGSALTPSSFGLNDPETGIWSPKAYTGTYGTNGFYLNFSDNSGTTSTTLGKDSSGNGNNWTPNNFSVTAGAGNDSLVDSPTRYGTDTGAGGEVRGNYCTWNPLVATDSSLTYANGNLNVSGGGSTLATRASISTIVVTSGKWYAEVNVGTTNNAAYAGIIKPSNLGVSRDISWNYYDNLIYPSGSGFSGTATSGDIIGIAYDADNGTVQFYKNGSTIGSQQTGATVGAEYGFYVEMGSGGQVQDWNFGQRPFAYTAPSGFKALCTTNLPTPTIGATSTTQANKYFDVKLYVGNAPSTNTISGVGFAPDFVWVKNRETAGSNHVLVDSVRGNTKGLYSNATDAEATDAGFPTLTSDGFTVADSSWANQSTKNLVSWLWNAGGSNATNTSGTITSTVRANTTAGFSIVTYTGTGVNATVGHGLGVAPSFIIVKSRTVVDNWMTWHTSYGGGLYFIELNTTNAKGSASNVWNSTTPTSTVFSVGTGQTVNKSTDTYVAYCFAPVAGYSAFGSYTGNGSTDGPFVHLGFRPRFVMIKYSSGVDNWAIFDTSREGYNADNDELQPNTSSAEGTADFIDILSNGFKNRNSDGRCNASGGTYIYAAFAESPFKYALAR